MSSARTRRELAPDVSCAGAKDVSDKITDEDQILGAKNKDAVPEPPEQQDMPPGAEDDSNKSKVAGWREWGHRGSRKMQRARST
jgi:hypothetical protein